MFSYLLEIYLQVNLFQLDRTEDKINNNSHTNNIFKSDLTIE